MKYRSTVLFALLSVSLVAAAAPPASDWQRVPDTGSREIFVSKQPVIRLGPIPIMAILTNFDAPQTTADGKVFRSSVVTRGFDCTQDAVAAILVAFQLYAKIDAEELLVSGGDQEALTVLPAEGKHTIHPSVMKLVCTSRVIEEQRDVFR